LIGFYFLNPSMIGTVPADRIIDTLIGSVIAYVYSMFVLPTWESSNLKTIVLQGLESAEKYFEAVGEVCSGTGADTSGLKYYRKEAVIDLGNISDTFQKMPSEPKTQRVILQDFHPLVAPLHLLTSYIASLSTYAQRLGDKFDAAGFNPKIKAISRQFAIANSITK